MPGFVEGDLGVVGLFVFALISIIALGELLHAKFSWRSESSRRVVHCLPGLVVVVAISRLGEPTYLYLVAVPFFIANLVFSRNRIFAGIHGIERRSLGTVTFPLALILGLYLTWTLDPGRKGMLQMAFLIMAISDPLASFVGTRFGSDRRKVGIGDKTWPGFLAFISSAALILFLFRGSLLSFELSIADLLVFALVLGLVELVSRSGWDNLFIVIGVICMLILTAERSSSTDLDPIIIVIAVATFMASSLRLNFLDRSGVVAAGILAFSLLSVGSWQWVIPALVFFASSSFLSKIRSKDEKTSKKVLAKGSTRDDGQVWANGGVALFISLLAILYPSPIWFVCITASFAAAAADTWATEIGMRWGKSPRSIIDFKQVEKGVSGGVSLFGTVGALLGSLVISLTYLTLESVQIKWKYFILLLLAGFVASLIDSLLGATLQAKYTNSEGQLTEKRASDSGANKLVRGFEFVDNDFVNLFSIASASILVLIAHEIL